MKYQRSRLENLIKLVPGDISDYRHLECFHYCSQQTGPVHSVYKLIDDHVCRRLSAPVVGVIVYGCPSANLAARNHALNDLFGGLDRASGLELLNRNLLCIRRVIIDPRYRGLGLATRLVKESLPLSGVPMVEALSVMGRIHPFFVRAGMQAHTCPPGVKALRLKAAMETISIDTTAELHTIHRSIECLSTQPRDFIEIEIGRFLQTFTSRRNVPHSIDRTEFVISRLHAVPRYYLWHNPDKRVIFHFCKQTNTDKVKDVKQTI